MLKLIYLFEKSVYKVVLPFFDKLGFFHLLPLLKNSSNYVIQKKMVDVSIERKSLA